MALGALRLLVPGVEFTAIVTGTGSYIFGPLWPTFYIFGPLAFWSIFYSVIFVLPQSSIRQQFTSSVTGPKSKTYKPTSPYWRTVPVGRYHHFCEQ